MEREGRGERDFTSAGSLPKCLLQPGLAQTKARILELILGLPLGWQGPNCLSPHLLPPPCILAESWNWKGSLELGLEPGILIEDAGVPSSNLTGMSNTYSKIHPFKVVHKSVIHIMELYNSHYYLIPEHIPHPRKKYNKVLVSLGCCNRMSQARYLKHRHGFFLVLEAIVGGPGRVVSDEASSPGLQLAGFMLYAQKTFLFL